MGERVACSMNPKSTYRDHLEPQVQDADIAAQAGKNLKRLDVSCSRFCLSAAVVMPPVSICYTPLFFRLAERGFPGAILFSAHDHGRDRDLPARACAP